MCQASFGMCLFSQGTVKVVRKQTVVDSVSSNERKFSSRNMDELGCGKYPSHAEGYYQALKSAL